MIRVLVAEDSETARSLLVQVLRSDPEIVVVGEAPDGAAAVKMADALRPDVITMDVRMPLLDGFEATRRIMAAAPTPVVVVSASLDPRDVEGSLQALRAGAVTVARKPTGPGAANFDELCRQLVRTVKSMAQVRVLRRNEPLVPAQAASAGRHVPAGIAAAPPHVVACAASIGGPATLYRVLSELPRELPAPVLVVQHIAPGFVQGLADWLGSATALRVKVAEHDEPLRAGTVYLAPDDRHLGVSGRSAVALSSAPRVGGFRPSATFLFESVARAFGRSTLALILTGMGTDGVAGLRAVRRAGGRVLAQDETTCTVFGMPGAAIDAGLADLVLPLPDIAGRLLDFFHRGPSA